MDPITVQDLINQIQPRLHGTGLGEVPGEIYDYFRIAAQNMLARISPKETIQRFQIVNAVYSRVYDYTAPPDIKSESAIIDLPPLAQHRSRYEDTRSTSVKEFDLYKRNNEVILTAAAGLQFLRISKWGIPCCALWTADSLSIDGTVTAFGDAGNLAINYLNCVSGSSAISFDLSGATGVGGITVNLPTGVDISHLLNLGALFEWLNFPGKTLQTVDLQWGQSASQCYSNTVTSPMNLPKFPPGGYGLLEFLWNGATVTGAPDPTNINFLQVTLNYTPGTAQSGVLVDNIVASLGRAYELLYYSNAIFLGTDGVLRPIPVSNSDQIMLSGAARTILLYEILRQLFAVLKGESMSTDLANINYELEGDGRVLRGSLVINRRGLYRDYIEEHPSQSVSIQTTYHRYRRY